MESKFFNKGDFVKYTSYNGSKEFKFGIFEGIDTSTTYSKNILWLYSMIQISIIAN